MADPLSLLSDDSDDYPNDTFRVNKAFSGHYDVWRQKEEMQKLKDIKNNISESSSESESEEEPVIEKDFLKALSLLKSDDPSIYNEGVELFKEDNKEVKKKPKLKKEKPMLMKDYERELVLNRNGEFSDEEDHCPPPEHLTFDEEEVKLKKAELPTLMAGDSDEDEDSDDGFLIRAKVKSEEEKEEADYLQFLKGQKDEVKEDVQELQFLHQYWNDPKLDKGEKFLRDYILNEKFVVKDKSDMNLTHSRETDEEVAMSSDDEEIIQQQEQFEHKYNFRFEEPDPEFIKRYPRTIGNSLRREDNRRKVKREEYTERKKKEKEQMREELKRLKALKRKEIEEKFLKLKEISGQDELNFDEDDMESDFDPDKHDKKMKELFNDDYYTVEEQQKPEFEYDEDLDNEKWDLWTREQNEINGISNATDNIKEAVSSDDAIKQKDNAKQQFEQEMIDSTRAGRKKGRKKSLFAQIISQPKPIYDPDGKSFDDYLDEYYKMDFEDVVGDMPVRFKYRKVVPNDFGLSVDEILTANDKELNRWCSVKKTCQYRHEDEEKYDVQAFQRKAQNAVVKQKILSSVYSLPKEVGEIQISNAESKEGNNKIKRRKKKKKRSAQVTGENKEIESSKAELEIEASSTIKTHQSEESCGVSENAKAKRKRKKNKSLLHSSSITSSPFLAVEGENTEAKKLMDTSSYISNADISKRSENKKSKQKKKKSNLNPSGEFEISNLENSRTDVLPSVYQISNSAKKADLTESKISSSLGSSSKTIHQSITVVKNKAKRKLEEAINVSDLNSGNFKKRKKKFENLDDSLLNETQKRESLVISNQTPGENISSANQSNKKSKKKKKQRSNPDFSSRNWYNKDLSSQNFSSGAKAQSKIPEADKKLALPNSRLASYGFNPKKFKNSIIYSK